MINTRATSYNNAVDITIHTRNFGSEDVSFARVKRKTTFTRDIIEKVLKKNSVFDEATLFHIANLFHEGIMELLQEGKAVSVLDLGTLYLKPKKGMSSTLLKDVPTMTVAFTPSDIVINAVKEISVGEDVTKPSIPQVEEVINVSRPSSSEFVSENVMRVKGKRLKVMGTGSGVFLVPEGMDEFENPNESWIMVAKESLTDNTNTQLEFALPASLAAGNYRLVIRTAASGGKSLKHPRNGMYSKMIVVA